MAEAIDKCDEARVCDLSDHSSCGILLMTATEVLIRQGNVFAEGEAVSVKSAPSREARNCIVALLCLSFLCSQCPPKLDNKALAFS